MAFGYESNLGSEEGYIQYFFGAAVTNLFLRTCPVPTLCLKSVCDENFNFPNRVAKAFVVGGA
jgi:hypothetical protein